MDSTTQGLLLVLLGVVIGGLTMLAWRVSEAHQALQPGLNELHAGMEITAYTKVA